MALQSDYQTLLVGPALVDRSYRALLEIGGADRAVWLHNLTTNQVKNLGRGEGNYAFVLNNQGRILFDVNVLVRIDSIWLDLDRCFLETARNHFTKYCITEDVTVVDRSAEFTRFGLVGRQAPSLLTELGVSNAAAMAQLNHVTIGWPIANPSRERGQPVNPNRDREESDQSRRREPTVIPIIRHDFCGPFAVEWFVPADRASEFRSTLIDRYRAVPVGDDAVQVRRIEAGIPWPGREITDEYLPAETRQLERAVNYQKGCYLGQEVVERMRSRGVVARQLVGLRLDGPIALPLPLGEGRGEGRPQVFDPDGKPTGLVTSACHSPALNAPIALAYVKTLSSAVGTNLNITWDGCTAKGVVVELPFIPNS